MNPDRRPKTSKSDLLYRSKSTPQNTQKLAWMSQLGIRVYGLLASFWFTRFGFTVLQ